MLGPAPATAGGAGMSGLTRYLLVPLGIAVLAVILIGGHGRDPALEPRRAGRRRRALAAPRATARSARTPRSSPPKDRFADVAGCDEAVEELREVVVFLSEPERFVKVGARMPRGVILHGPPGTGKTLLAKAVAGESGVPFFALSGSDFVDTFVGVGASRVRDLFATARKSETGAIIFFDEIDAIGRARGAGMSGADSEREGTLNQLLVELDGFGARDRVVVIAATNRLDMLDPALLRPGRFDRRVQVGLPAEAGRLSILKLHSKHMPIGEPASLEALARVTAGFAGADLANIVNEAAIMAARDGPRGDPGHRPRRGPAARRRRPPEGRPAHRRGRARGDRLARGRPLPGRRALPHAPEGPAGHDPRPRRRRGPRPLRQPGPRPHLPAAPARAHGRGDGRPRGRADRLRRDLLRGRQRPRAGQQAWPATPWRSSASRPGSGRSSPRRARTRSRSRARRGASSTRRSTGWSTRPTPTPSPCSPTTAPSSRPWAPPSSSTSRSTAPRSRRSSRT